MKAPKLRIIPPPEAEQQLTQLYHYIAKAASPNLAARYVDAIISYCESLQTFPHRGTQRDDVRAGLRITNYKKRAVIAFALDTEVVSILGVFYGGQNYEAILQEALIWERSYPESVPSMPPSFTYATKSR